VVDRLGDAAVAWEAGVRACVAGVFFFFFFLSSSSFLLFIFCVSFPFSFFFFFFFQQALENLLYAR